MEEQEKEKHIYMLAYVDDMAIMAEEERDMKKNTEKHGEVF